MSTTIFFCSNYIKLSALHCYLLPRCIGMTSHHYFGPEEHPLYPVCVWTLYIRVSSFPFPPWLFFLHTCCCRRMPQQTDSARWRDGWGKSVGRKGTYSISFNLWKMCLLSRWFHSLAFMVDVVRVKTSFTKNLHISVYWSLTHTRWNRHEKHT